MSKKNVSPIGSSWDALEQECFTPDEIAASKLRASLVCEIVRARQNMGISQKKLEELSGVKQPIIARMEKGSTSPNLSTVLKVLAPLGKTLYIGDITVYHAQTDRTESTAFASEPTDLFPFPSAPSMDPLAA